MFDAESNCSHYSSMGVLNVLLTLIVLSYLELHMTAGGGGGGHRGPPSDLSPGEGSYKYVKMTCICTCIHTNFFLFELNISTSQVTNEDTNFFHCFFI